MYYSCMNDTVVSRTPNHLDAILQTAHALEARLETALGEAGLSGAKFSVLSELVRSGEPLALSELASRLACVRSNMTQLVDRLEADGLVRGVSSRSSESWKLSCPGRTALRSIACCSRCGEALSSECFFVREVHVCTF